MTRDTNIPYHYVPFSQRRFTLDGEPCDIEDFISSNSTTFKEAADMRVDLMSLAVDYRMYFHFDGDPTEREIYRMT